MCGITGIISIRPNQFSTTDVTRMSECLSHRGPDGKDSWQNATATAFLAHNRLAIVDLSAAAAQPMQYLDRYTIVHNGEIYNYPELRQALAGKGYVFRTQSDTEVILAAYDYWKEGCLQHFDGMFAFAIWDEKERSLFAARDRFGEKPFFYYCDHVAKTLHFASELKSFYRAGFSKNEINENLLLQYLATGVSFTADSYRTFHRYILKLPARHYLRFTPFSDGSVLEIEPYYDIDKMNRTDLGAEGAVQRFRELFYQSVARRLRSDVGIGASLSGGIDSSSVLAAGSKEGIQKAFTASFPGFEKDETEAAASVATLFNVQHQLVRMNQDALAQGLQRFLQQHDEPVSSSSVYAQFKVYETAAQEGIKVILDGQGADEILAGYDRYYHWYLQELYARRNKVLLQKELHASGYPFGFRNKMAAMFPGWAAIQLERRAYNDQKTLPDLHPDFLYTSLRKETIYKPVVRSLNDILYSDVFDGRLEELLRNADRNAMANGVEVRLPFLSHELVEFVFGLPGSFKFYNGHTKYVLRQAMDDVLPKAITWNRVKTGFEPPQQRWMQAEAVQEQVRESKALLVKEKILRSSVLDKPINPQPAHEAGNHDWRYLSAATLFGN